MKINLICCLQFNLVYCNEMNILLNSLEFEAHLPPPTLLLKFLDD